MLNSDQVHSWVPRKWLRVTFCRDLKGTKPQGYCISPRIQSGERTHPDVLPAHVPPPTSNQRQAYILTYSQPTPSHPQVIKHTQCRWVKHTAQREDILTGPNCQGDPQPTRSVFPSLVSCKLTLCGVLDCSGLTLEAGIQSSRSSSATQWVSTGLMVSKSKQ